MDILEILNELWSILHPDSDLNLQLSFWAGAGGSLISAAGSLFSGLFGNKAQKDANRTNLQIARETNENQYRMFKEGNDFSARMANEAWNRETSYNDPAAQLARYQRAGINGQVAMSGSLGSAGTTAADMAAPQSLAPPTLHAPTVAPVPSVFDMESMANILSTLADADKKGAEASNIRGMFEVNLENAIEEREYKKLMNTYQGIQNNILAKTGLDKAFGELREQNARILLNDEMTITEKTKQVDLLASAFLKRAEEKLTKEKYNQLVETFPLLKKQLNANIELLQEQKKTEGTKQEANRASANASNATAENQRAQARNTDEDTEGKKIDNHYRPYQNESEIESRDRDASVKEYDAETRRGEAKGRSYGSYSKNLYYPEDGDDDAMRVNSYKNSRHGKNKRKVPRYRKRK